MPPKLIVSFGFRHGLPSDAKGGQIIDVRQLFGRNPYHNKQLRPLRGDNPLVIEDILQTPDFDNNYQALKEIVSLYDGTVWLGCTGGHHRSVYLANRLAKELECDVLHWNYHDK